MDDKRFGFRACQASGFIYLCVIGLSLLPSAAMSAERIAFVVGNSQYEEITSLPNPKNDANDIGDRLKTLGFKLHADKVHHNLGKRQLQREYNRFSAAAEGAEIALFYFAGHGMQFDGTPHVLPVDIPDDDLNIVESDAIGLNSMLDQLGGRAELTVAIFDACREIPDYTNEIGLVTRGGSDRAWRGLSRPTVQAESTLIAYSGSSGELVADGSGRNSPYTAILLDYLDQAKLEENRFDIPELFGEVSYQFRRKHDGQSPEVINQGVRPNRYFLSSQVSEIIANQQQAVVAPTQGLSDLSNHKWIEADLGLTREERYQIQVALNNMGIATTGVPDGILGKNTRLGIARFNSERGFPSGEYLSAQGYKQLMQEESVREAKQRYEADQQKKKNLATQAALIEEKRRQSEIELLIENIKNNLSDLKLTSPLGSNANHGLTQLELLDSINPFIDKGREQIISYYVNWIEREISNGETRKAEDYLDSLAEVPGSKVVTRRLKAAIEDAKNQAAEELHEEQAKAEQSLRESNAKKVQVEQALNDRKASLGAAKKAEQDLSISRSWRRGIQVALNDSGISVGAADGVWGLRTRVGIKQWQSARGLQETGYLSANDYQRLVSELNVQEVRNANITNVTEPVASTNSGFPDMVKIQGGTHRMGSLAVTITSFEIGQYEVTVSQFRKFINSTGYRTDAMRNVGGVRGCNIWNSDKKEWQWRAGGGVGFEQADDHPVTCISWNDVQAYLKWLNVNSTGGYRLPSEAEWEYAASAGTQSDWSFDVGKGELCDYGNGADSSTKSELYWSSVCNDSYKRTAPVGKFLKNGNQLYDIHGNVGEWAEDCWHSSFKGIPRNGAAWTKGCDQNKRVMKGGAWYHGGAILQTRHRYWFNKDYRDSTTGFRIARSSTN